MNLNEDIEQYSERTSESKINRKKIALIGLGVLFLLTLLYFISQIISENFKEKREKKAKIESVESNSSSSTKKPIEAKGYQGSKYNIGEPKTPIATVKNEKNQEVRQEVMIAPSYNEDMKNYYERLIQEELSARKSMIAFDDTGRTSNESSNFLPPSSSGTSMNIPGGMMPESDPNKIKEKKEFLSGKDEAKTDIYNSQGIVGSYSPHQVMAGSIIPGILITGIKSTLPGKMIGQVRENVYDSVSGAYLLIPKGAKLMGLYDSNVTFGQNRVMIIWERIIFPSGKSIQLDRFSGTDLSGYAGVTGKVNNHYGKLLTSVVLSSVIGAGTAVVTNDDKDDKDWKASAGQGAGEQIINIGNKFAERILNIAPEITIPKGAKFNIIVNSDLILEPIER